MAPSVLLFLLIITPFMNVECIKRGDFPDGFVFGTASSAYQFEGAANEGNKGASIWDTFTRQPGRILDFSNADTAVDQYHRFESDIDLMKDLGMDAYRFSISWPRIFPNGTGEPNPDGINYYNRLIDALLEKGIQPYVTLYHWDLPQMLEDTYEGWLSKYVVEDYKHFAYTCFRAFGDRVKHWITFNEPHGFSIQGYDTGIQAPGRCSILGGLLCKAGNSSTEPYIVAHNILLSHAAVYHTYRLKFKVILSNLSAAIREDNCDIRGYFVWSLLDNWEWNSGYTVRFGLYHINYRNNLTRIPKASVEWFKNMLKPRNSLNNLRPPDLRHS